jgi:hypothetical protein
MLQVTVPPQDEAIGSALADLEVKLSAWVSAMSGAQDALARQVILENNADESRELLDAESDAPEFVKSDGTAANDTEETGEQDRTDDAVAFDSPSGTQTVVTDRESTEVEQSPAVEKAPASKRVTRGIQPGPGFVAPEPPLANEEPASANQQGSEEDEALLATLDEKTVKALRVMRRLSVIKKSMKELLAEYQAEQANVSETPSPARGSWWKRK